VVWNALGSTMFSLNTVILVVAISRTADLQAVGFFSIALAIAQLLFIIGVFGANSLQMTDYRRQFSFADYSCLKLGSCVLMIIVCLLVVVFGLSEPAKQVFTLLLTAFFVLTAVGELYQSLFFQNNRLDLSGKALFFRMLFSTVAFLAALYLTLDIVWALVALNLASLVGLWLWGIRPAKAFAEKQKPIDRRSLGALFKECLPLFISTFLTLLIFNASRYGIEYFSNDTVQGYFALLVLPVLFINLLSQFIFRPALSGLSQSLDACDRRGFLRLSARLSLTVLLCTVLVAALMPLLGIPLLSWLYAVELSALSVEAVLLVVGGGLYAFHQLLYFILVIMRQQRAMLLLYLLATLATAAISVPCIVYAGLLGSCLAFALPQLLLSLGFVALVLRRLPGAGVATRG
jgi:O-antigen/teichoic acid export membrane protein